MRPADRKLLTMLFAVLGLGVLLLALAGYRLLSELSAGDQAQWIEAWDSSAAQPAADITAGPAREATGDSEGARPKMDDAKLAEMKDKLTPEQYNICFLKGTEPPFSGKYYKTKDPGEYHCAACGALLFYSDTKFDSGTGWPSFWEAAVEGAIGYIEDRSHGMIRTEVTCANCGAHLGHVFNDGPAPSGQRYCINSLSLDFRPNDQRQPARD